MGEVRANNGAPGADAVSIGLFEEQLRDNLFKLWNRMSSGSYFPVRCDAVLLIRTLFARPVRHRGAIGGMAVFWAGDALAVWSALAAFGLLMNGAALIGGCCTGMVFTRRTAPVAGSGTLTLILPRPAASGAAVPGAGR